MSEWQPIETAPRNGERIMIYSSCKVEIAKWGGYPNLWGIKDEHGYVPDIWIGWIGDDANYDSEFYPPKYWMPLPKMPQK
jgi:hypothetical protein